MKPITVFVALSTLLLLAQCNSGGITEGPDRQFGDQHFKTAIALIELHKIRFGEYPKSLDSLKFTGDWDGIAFSSVKYEKLDSGYALDLTRGSVGKPKTLSYPDQFWKGLGLVRSNLKK